MLSDVNEFSSDPQITDG